MGEQGWRLGHRPGLDGVRGIAIALVLVFHFTGLAVGTAGVELFFVLSGFLITSLLVEEHEQTGSVALGRFYWRRGRRLFPALVVMVGVLALLALVVGEHLPVAPTLFYYANWAQGELGVGPLGHTWSLAVEEQFYLTWPLALVVALRWRHGPLVLAVTAAAASLASRLVVHDPFHVYMDTETQAWGLLLGCALALLARRGLPALRVPAWVLVGVLASSALVTDPLVNRVTISALAPVVAVPLVWVGCSQPGLAWAPLRYLGQRSYGLYLWHYPILALAGGVLHVPPWPVVVVVAALSFGAAELSYRYVERPFRTAALPRLGLARRPGVSLAEGTD
jgi:peptidoglycan/LPS O-acetylase OafA/YrhL